GYDGDIMPDELAMWSESYDNSNIEAEIDDSDDSEDDCQHTDHLPLIFEPPPKTVKAHCQLCGKNYSTQHVDNHLMKKCCKDTLLVKIEHSYHYQYPIDYGWMILA